MSRMPMLNRMAMPRGKAAAMTTGMNQVGGFLTHNTGCGCARFFHFEMEPL